MNNQEKYYARQKERILAHYGASCICCGEANSSFLCIDHVNNDGNKERKIYRTTSTMATHIIQRNFPDTYQILCYNCNNGKRKTGVCPHKSISARNKLVQRLADRRDAFGKEETELLAAINKL